MTGENRPEAVQMGKIRQNPENAVESFQIIRGRNNAATKIQVEDDAGNGIGRIECPILWTGSGRVMPRSTSR
jgi:hypothetical protein